MKELTVEQKAQAYDEAIKIAISEKDKSRNLELLESIDRIFPELRETEGEMMRRFLIDYFSVYFSCIKSTLTDGIWKGFKIDDIIAYIERQKEQKFREWNEEDEKMVDDIIAAIYSLYYHGMVNWLKSLKQRLGGI